MALACGHHRHHSRVADSIRGVPLRPLARVCNRLRIDEVLINLHAHVAPVREFLRRRVDATPVRIVEEPELLGSAGTLRANRDWIGSDDLFWVFYADVLNCADLEGMLRMHASAGPQRRSVSTRFPIPGAAAS